MNVIIVSKFFRTPQKLALHEPRVGATVAAAVLAILGLSFGIGYGVGGSRGAAAGEIAQLRGDLAGQQRQLQEARDAAQIEINAIAARVGELQAQANRLNALGERLTRSGKLNDGEFDFERTPGMGGAETASDVPAGDLLRDLDALQSRFDASGRQLSVLEAMLYNQQVEQQSVPSQRPSNGYITSGFGTRADPFSGGRAHHLGLDFDANRGDPVRSAANGVISYAGVKNGYGNVIEIDHGNGYSTLYGHNSRLLVRAGDLVRAGQVIAKAGSTGRSTGPHVHFEVHQNGRPVNPRPFLDLIGG